MVSSLDQIFLREAERGKGQHPNLDTNQRRWVDMANRARYVQPLKRITLIVVGILNFAALSGAFALVVLYVPIPDELAVLSPVFSGVLATLASMKFWFFHKAKNITGTGGSGGGKGALKTISAMFTYAFFAPLVLAGKLLDKNAYHDPNKMAPLGRRLANRKTSLREMSEFLHTRRIYPLNLGSFGLMTKETSNSLHNLIKDFKRRDRECVRYERRERTSPTTPVTYVPYVPTQEEFQNEQHVPEVDLTQTLENIPENERAGDPRFYKQIQPPSQGLDAPRLLNEAYKDLAKMEYQWTVIQGQISEEYPNLPESRSKINSGWRRLIGKIQEFSDHIFG